MIGDALNAFSEVLLPVVVVVVLGYLLRRSFALDIRTLNRASLYVFSPCLVFVTLLRTEVAGAAASRLVMQMLLVMSSTLLCGFLVAAWLRLIGPQRSGFLLTTTFMNSGNYGLSVTRFAFGEAGFQFALISYLTQAILSQSLAVYLASAGSNGRRAALTQVFRVPLIYAVVLALGLRLFGIRLDETQGPIAVGLYRGLRLVADATLPLLLLILGTQLHAQPKLEARGALGAAMLIRLLLSIPLAYGAGLLLGLSGLPLYVGVIQAAMPTAVNMMVVALEFDAWPEFVSNGVVATTLGSLVSLTILIAVVR
ncbi:MAG: AEC family transporter [Roseiflexaceae bacterium]|nr:AEC family transporter [Roseiflexaceae bacterium]